MIQSNGELKTKVQNYLIQKKENKKNGRTWFPINLELKKEILEYTKEQRKLGFSVREIAESIDSPVQALYQYISDEKLGKRNGRNYTVKKHRLIEEIPPLEAEKTSGLKVIFQHPQLGEIFVSGDKAKAIWNKMAQL